MSTAERRLFGRLPGAGTVTDMHRADCRGCGECCGRYLPLTVADKIRLEGYVRTHGIKPHPERPGLVDFTCPYLSEGRECMVYEARPEICRRYSCRLHAAGGLEPWPALFAAAEVDMRELADSLESELAG